MCSCSLRNQPTHEGALTTISSDFRDPNTQKRTRALRSSVVESESSGARDTLRSAVHRTIQSTLRHSILAFAGIHCKTTKRVGDDKICMIFLGNAHTYECTSCHRDLMSAHYCTMNILQRRWQGNGRHVAPRRSHKYTHSLRSGNAQILTG